ncbi:MAG: AAA family ATPase [Phaeodactylibacter xiamenensis]|uniref:AAA family ATPase n=1 Tax=Phaeodactylibacter xiamenensis TaxID=1524460 RepID=UPI0009077E21
MYRGVLYKALEDHLDRKLITVVTGMRRVGKTTAVKYLLEKVAHDNKAYIDFEKIEHRHIFMQSSHKEVQIESKSNAALYTIHAQTTTAHSGTNQSRCTPISRAFAAPEG